MTLRPVHTIELDSVASTHQWALQNAGRLAKEGQLTSKSFVCVSAQEQVAGIGKPGKVWLTPKGNLAVTYLKVWPTQEVFELSALLPLTAAMAVVTSLQSVLPSSDQLALGIKWINDIVCGDRKLGGVLCEAVPSTQSGYMVIAISVGLNLVITPDSKDLLETEKQPMTSVAAECPSCPKEHFRSLMLAGLSSRLQLSLQQLRAERQLPENELKRLLVGIGQNIRIESEGQSDTGLFQGVDVKTGAVILMQKGQSVLKGERGGSLYFI